MTRFPTSPRIPSKILPIVNRRRIKKLKRSLAYQSSRHEEKYLSTLTNVRTQIIRYCFNIPSTAVTILSRLQKRVVKQQSKKHQEGSQSGQATYGLFGPHPFTNPKPRDQTVNHYLADICEYLSKKDKQDDLMQKNRRQTIRQIQWANMVLKLRWLHFSTFKNLQTFFKAISFLNKLFKSETIFDKMEYEPTSIVCLQLAGKMLQYKTPTFCYYHQFCPPYKAKYMVEMEKYVLSELNFNLNEPSFYQHMQRLAYVFETEQIILRTATYYCELAAFISELFKTSPLTLGAALLSFAYNTFDRDLPRQKFSLEMEINWIKVEKCQKFFEYVVKSRYKQINKLTHFQFYYGQEIYIFQEMLRKTADKFEFNLF